jgi:hypothetical protein
VPGTEFSTGAKKGAKKSKEMGYFGYVSEVQSEKEANQNRPEALDVVRSFNSSTQRDLNTEAVSEYGRFSVAE